MAVYSVLSDVKYIYSLLSSRDLEPRYDQYYFCIRTTKYPNKIYYNLRFSTKQDLVNFNRKFWCNYYTLNDTEKEQNFLFELLTKTANEWDDNKKLKTKRLLTQICKNM